MLSSLGVWALLLAATLLDVHLGWRVLASVMAGLVSVRLFIIYHDFQHGAILKNSRIGRFLMSAYGLWILSPPSIWRRSHNFHHKHNAKIYGASIGSYPVLTTDAWRKATAKERRRYRYARHPLTIAFGYWSMFVHGMCYKSLRTNPKLHGDSLLALGLHVGLIVGLGSLGWDIVGLTLFVPLFVVHALGAYLFYAQHNYPDVQLRRREDWDYVHAALHSSSYMEMGPVMHWFTGNIGYHHVHHLNPRIPFYRLPEAMAAIPALAQPGTTSLAPKDVWTCLMLDLWDMERQKMVRFSDA